MKTKFRRILQFLFCTSIMFLVGSPTASASSGDSTIPDSRLIPLADRPGQGPSDAPLVIVEFINFECRFSARGADTITRLQARHPDQIRIVSRHRLFETDDRGRDAARVAEAADRQGAFWEMRQALFDRQIEILGGGDARALGIELAGALGLDVEQFRRDLDDPAIDERIATDLGLAQNLDVQGSPGYFLNGFPIDGAHPLVSFERVVEQANELRRELIADGIADEELYAASVIAIHARIKRGEHRRVPVPAGPTTTRP